MAEASGPSPDEEAPTEKTPVEPASANETRPSNEKPSPGGSPSGPGLINTFREVDPQVLAEIGHLALRARMVADSALSGMHRSPKHGSSVEFAEHKEYSPGDDVRHLDWRAYARVDRDLIKRFEDESSLRALLVVDRSGTMGYPAPPAARWTKLEWVKTAAGALAVVLARQGDGVGLATFADKLTISVPPRARRGHLQEVLSALNALEADGKTQLDQAVQALSKGLSKRTLVILFTDLLDGGLEALSTLARLRARRNDVVLFHTLDLDEVEFPFEDSTLFVGMESADSLQIDAREIRKAYLDELEKFCTEAETMCRRAQVEYHRARTDQSPGQVLARFLAGRARIGRMAR